MVLREPLERLQHFQRSSSLAVKVLLVRMDREEKVEPVAVAVVANTASFVLTAQETAAAAAVAAAREQPVVLVDTVVVVPSGSI